VELEGEQVTLAGTGHWSDTFSRRNVGRVGYLARSSQTTEDRYHFCAYHDQSLRRAPELDLLDHRNCRLEKDGRMLEIVGWRCNRYPNGFRAPVGLVPGEDGAFVRDETVSVTVRVPPEFVEQCRLVQRTPEEVLHGFIGDLAGIQNYVTHPRADGYGSNGSDERMYAENWLDRAYGQDRVPLEKLLLQDEETREHQDDVDQLAECLDDFLRYGGKRQDFLDAVDALIEKQAGTTGAKG
jgi:hypothetical protein